MAIGDLVKTRGATILADRANALGRFAEFIVEVCCYAHFDVACARFRNFGFNTGLIMTGSEVRRLWFLAGA